MTLVWASAPRLPITMVTMASTATAGCHSPASAGTACRKTRRKAAKAAALTPADMSAVTVVGAPS